MFLSTSFANSAFYKKYLEKKFRENFVDMQSVAMGKRWLTWSEIKIFLSKKSGFINKSFMRRKDKLKNV